MTEANRSEFFRLVEAWNNEVHRTKVVYDETVATIRAAILPVGSEVTTSADAHGYCMTFRVTGDSFSTGATDTGVVHLEVGDRCATAYAAWREQAVAVHDARLALLRYIKSLTESTEPEFVAFALYKDLHG